LYFFFADVEQGILRYREDEFIDPTGKIEQVRSRLTLIGPTSEDKFEQEVLLSRSRYLAPATQSPRFYREYFKPHLEKKSRRTAIATWCVIKMLSFSLTLTLSLNQTLDILLKSKVEPGAGRMRK